MEDTYGMVFTPSNVRYNIWLLCFKERKKERCSIDQKVNTLNRCLLERFTGVSLFRSWGSLVDKK